MGLESRTMEKQGQHRAMSDGAGCVPLNLANAFSLPAPEAKMTIDKGRRESGFYCYQISTTDARK